MALGVSRSPYACGARTTRTMVEHFMRFSVTVGATVIWGAAVVAVAVLGYLAY